MNEKTSTLPYQPVWSNSWEELVARLVRVRVRMRVRVREETHATNTQLPSPLLLRVI